MYRAAWDDDLDQHVVVDDYGVIHARNCADRHTAEDVAHAMNAAASLDGIDVCSNAA